MEKLLSEILEELKKINEKFDYLTGDEYYSLRDIDNRLSKIEDNTDK